MSTGADAAADDASMTRDAGASRTFRSLFGGASARRELRERAEELKRRIVSDGDGQSVDSAAQDGGDDAMAEAAAKEDDDDDGAWSDDAAPPREELDNNRLHHAAAPDADDHLGFSSSSSGGEEAVAAVIRSSRAKEATRVPEQRRAMEEWADDEDEEDAWKDMLQAKVNQLELVIQNSEGSPVTPLANATATTAVAQLEFTHADSRIALAAATHIAALRGGAERPATRGKLQRAADAHHRQGTASAAALSSPPNYLRKRTGSRDFGPSSRASKAPTAEAKRFAKAAPSSSSSSSRRDSLPRSSSANAISSSLANRAPQRKNSLDACSVGTLSSARHSGSAADTHRGTAAVAAAAATKAAHEAHAVSEAEAVRRFLLNDIKKMSMDRLVADAKRLQFLEAFYKQQHSGGGGPPSAAPTAG